LGVKLVRQKIRSIYHRYQQKWLHRSKYLLAIKSPLRSPVKEEASKLLASGLFDSEWYVRKNPDVASGKLMPAEHYVSSGWKEGRDPSPLFANTWYLEKYPDVAEHGQNPLTHYLQLGGFEGRDPHPLFDSDWYLEKYPDVTEHGQNPLTHYLQLGGFEGRDPHPLFDSDWYLEQNPDVAERRQNPLDHYLQSGAFEGCDPHPLFDSDWYLEQNPDIRRNGVNPLEHYLRFGAAEGRDPHPLFDSHFYQQQQREAASLRSKQSSPISLKQRCKKFPSESNQPKVYAFTSICLNYVPKARVLAQSLKLTNPEVYFCLLVNEPIPDGILDSFIEFDEVIEIQELSIPNLKSWIFSHSVVELCTAVKGFFALELLQREDCKSVFYFDPDMVVFSSIDPLLNELESASILLTPHQTEPEVTQEAIIDNEICSLKHGVYNLGFLGLKPSKEGIRFAQWWRDRLEYFCKADIPGGLFTDQRWVDLAPAFFEDLKIIRHPGCNVATWNLTNRHIEGDFDQGFTVNGEKLIFYHFSGFDSGAQEIMLNRYGKGMQSAFLLRQWYLQRTQDLDDGMFSNRPWIYDYFENGTRIPLEARQLYRERSDLQMKFPDPFDSSSSPDANFLTWYKSEVLDKNHNTAKLIQDALNESNPLLHFLNEGPACAIKPNPYFDPTFYVNAYRLILDCNPLIHYLRYGDLAGCQPCAEFDGHFYRSHLSESLRKQNSLVHYLTEGHFQNLRIHPRFSITDDLKIKDDLISWCNSSIPIILMVGHSGGGGTEKHVSDLIDCIGNQAGVLMLTPRIDKTVLLSVNQSKEDLKLCFDPINQFQELIELLNDCNIARIHIHHAYGNEPFLKRIVRSLGCPFDFTLHDYYVLSPSPHLLDDNSQFVGEDLKSHAEILLKTSISSENPTSLSDWQATHRWLIEDAERVIVPSRDVANRLQIHYPRTSPIIAAHPEKDWDKAEVYPPSLNNDELLRIAVIGELAPHKGLEVVLSAAKEAYQCDLPLSFQVVGYPTVKMSDFQSANVKVTGSYEDQKLLQLIAELNPHLLWYPAQWPETYSYTLSAGLRTGLPLVVSDIGALPERVAGRPWSWVQPWTLNDREWNQFFLLIRNKHFLTGISPQISPEVEQTVQLNFYDDEYLKPLQVVAL
jgi:glycosyltransferase involved in cell wall biosynthesis